MCKVYKKFWNIRILLGLVIFGNNYDYANNNNNDISVVINYH